MPHYRNNIPNRIGLRRAAVEKQEERLGCHERQQKQQELLRLISQVGHTLFYKKRFLFPPEICGHFAPLLSLPFEQGNFYFIIPQPYHGAVNQLKQAFGLRVAL